MKFIQKRHLLLLAVAITVVFTNTSCKKDEIETSGVTSEEQSTGPLTKHKMIEISEPHEDIYTVESMRAALNELHEKGELLEYSPKDIKATHYYVRFLPKDQGEFEILRRTEGIYLYDYPLDVDLIGDGTYYHDPSLPLEAITWQYTVVPIDFEFPEFEYEKLKEVVLSGPGYESAKMASFGLSDYNLIENQSLIMHGLENEAKSLTSSGEQKTAFLAHGYIKTYDDWKEEILPVVGVKVRATRFFNTSEDATNDAGYYNIKDYGGKVRYTIKWENAQYFDLRDGNYGQFITTGPKQQSGWSETFTEDHEKYAYTWSFTHAYRAAYEYFHSHDEWGIDRPPYNNGSLNQRLHIGVKTDEQGSNSHYFAWNSFFQSAEILVHTHNSSARDVFGTTIHEMAHATHWAAANQGFNWITHSGKVLVESWAEGVEDYVLNLHDYSNGSQRYIPVFNDPLIGDPKLENTYTCVIEDLIDDYNQVGHIGSENVVSCQYGGVKEYLNLDGNACYVCEVGEAPSGTNAAIWPDPHGWFFHDQLPGGGCNPGEPLWGGNCMFQDVNPNAYGWVKDNKYYLDPTSSTGAVVDHVSGFTLGELEDIVHQCDNMGEFKQKLKETGNPTVGYIDELFANFGF